MLAAVVLVRCDDAADSKRGDATSGGTAGNGVEDASGGGGDAGGAAASGSGATDASGGTGTTDASDDSAGAAGSEAGGSAGLSGGGGSAGADAAAPDAAGGAAATAGADAGADARDGAVGCSATGPSGAAVTLQTPPSTFSQTVLVNASVALALDGNLGTGWSISDGTLVLGSETAAFETATDTPAHAGGTRLTFVLSHTFNSPGDHALGRFRLSITTATRAQFADGVDGTASPGDVGLPTIWTILTPTTVCASEPITSSLLGDGSVLVADHNLGSVLYAVVAETPLTGITGVRLEVLEDPSLPFDGPGLQDINGNFVLTEIDVYEEGQ